MKGALIRKTGRGVIGFIIDMEYMPDERKTRSCPEYWCEYSSTTTLESVARRRDVEKRTPSWVPEDGYYQVERLEGTSGFVIIAIESPDEVNLTPSDAVSLEDLMQETED